MDANSITTLATHFSKEIELATQMIIEQRTKNNLVVALGPFIILGAIAANGHAISLVASFPRRALLALSSLFLVSYGALGYLSAQIELDLWMQANRWRRELASLYGMNEDVFIFSPNGLVATYVSIYLAIGLAFISMLFLILWGHRRKISK